ncbi:trehalose-phosphatase [Jatrophihabitans sp.]|uniref:trehalose-phosphatase n=1 Tax=Jatrophihabitans sp. TaxID=1932789 RepID=UPI0030C77EB0|nr:trehalose-phosphatase [Jatrophihabitans sp.]
METAEVIAAARAALPELLVAVDFDGTLAPLTADPQQSRPVEGAIEALVALAGLGAQVAVITGRDALTALRLGGFEQIPGVVVAGLYGAETWAGGSLVSPPEPASMQALRDRLPSALTEAGADPDIWIEDKRLSLVVHARQTRDPQAALATVETVVRTLGRAVGAEVHPGRDVLELRMPGFDKAGALRGLIDARPGATVIYLGDDLGDLPAFTEIRALRASGGQGYGVGVRSSGVPEVAAAADVMVDGAEDVVRVLRAISA